MEKKELRRSVSIGSDPTIILPEEEAENAAAEIEKSGPGSTGTFNPKKSIFFALSFAFAGSAVWAGISFLSGYQIGIVAIVIGILAGNGAARGGTGPKAQKIGAAAAAVGYFAGQWGVILLYSSKDMQGMSDFIFFLSNTPHLLYFVLKSTFSSIEALFLGIVVHQGYSIPARK